MRSYRIWNGITYKIFPLSSCIVGKPFTDLFFWLFSKHFLYIVIVLSILLNKNMGVFAGVGMRKGIYGLTQTWIILKYTFTLHLHDTYVLILFLFASKLWQQS